MSYDVVKVPHFRAKVIAIGVGDGRKENLRYISQSIDHNIRLKSIEDLSSAKTANKIKTMLQSKDGKC